MSAASRPNLGGLFNGSTPPDRSSSIAAALRAPESADRESADPSPSSGSAGSSGSSRSAGPTAPTGSQRAKRSTPTATTSTPPMGAPVPPLGSAAGSAREATDTWAALQWLDPVRVLGFYFDALQAAFDAQRRLTMTVASVVSAPVRRAGIWR